MEACLGITFKGVHLEGGGWCDTIESCSARAMTSLGSSNYFEDKVPFEGVLSSHRSQNPDFFNWNRVKIRYCDGASFAGHPEAEFKNETRLFFRGQLIWETIMDELLSMGMSDAKQGILTGCSAGGLASLIHCDYFRDHMPKESFEGKSHVQGSNISKRNETLRVKEVTVEKPEEVANVFRDEDGEFKMVVEDKSRDKS